MPVPRIPLAAYPHAVREWIDGIPLATALDRDPAAAHRIGAAVARTLHTISRQMLALDTVPPLVPQINVFLFARNGARWLPTGVAGLIVALAQEHGDTIDRTLAPGLVHGDFQGDNILVRDGVAGVLDWEWAHHGTALRGLGSLLRYDGAAAPAFQCGMESALDLPCSWRTLARIADFAAQTEKLAWPTHRGAVTDRAVRQIEASLAVIIG